MSLIGLKLINRHNYAIGIDKIPGTYVTMNTYLNKLIQPSDVF